VQGKQARVKNADLRSPVLNVLMHVLATAHYKSWQL